MATVQHSYSETSPTIPPRTPLLYTAALSFEHTKRERIPAPGRHVTTHVRFQAVKSLYDQNLGDCIAQLLEMDRAIVIQRLFQKYIRER
jgi:hypothetical protein